MSIPNPVGGEAQMGFEAVRTKPANFRDLSQPQTSGLDDPQSGVALPPIVLGKTNVPEQQGQRRDQAVYEEKVDHKPSDANGTTSGTRWATAAA
jgi:hypothetical protein